MPQQISATQSETIALQALAWLVGHDELLPVFLGATGATQADLQARATDSAFLTAVLDFLTMDDAWVIAFCDSQSLPYETLQTARAVLAGPGQMHWT